MLNEINEVNNDFIIKLHGNFDADMVKGMKYDIESYSTVNANIIFDLNQVQFIDSSGIGAIVFLYKRMVAKGFSVSVIGLTPQPLELFQLLFLDRTINCYQNMDVYKKAVNVLQVAS